MTTITHSAAATSKAIKISAIITRTLLGLMFVVFGLNGFLNFIPMGPMPEGPAATFLGGLAQSGYFFPFLKGMEVIIGVMLLLNLFTPLALVMLVPINLNILAFHLFLTPGEVMMSIVLVALNFYLAWVYRNSYRQVLINKAVI